MSDVLIRGMEMPKQCYDCPMHRYVYPDHLCVLYCLNIPDVRFRPGWCPLIELPPHGYLVDINALKLAILDVDYVNKHDYLKGVLNAINHAPTVIEASEVET